MTWPNAIIRIALFHATVFIASALEGFPDTPSAYAVGSAAVLALVVPPLPLDQIKEALR